MPWTQELKVQILLTLPWTVIPEDGDGPGERILRVKELPDVIVTGLAGTVAEREELTRDFWDSLKESLTCYVGEDVDPPLPGQLLGRPLPWRQQAPTLEPKQTGFAVRFTPSMATDSVKISPVAETEMPPGRLEKHELAGSAA